MSPTHGGSGVLAVALAAVGGDSSAWSSASAGGPTAEVDGLLFAFEDGVPREVNLTGVSGKIIDQLGTCVRRKSADEGHGGVFGARQALFARTVRFCQSSAMH